MNSVLEEQRRLHEERERLEDAMSKEFMIKKSSVRDEINSDHRVSELLQRNADVCQKLSALYEDGDGLRQEEVDALSGTDEFGEFYRKLRNLKDYHRSASSNVEEPLQMEFLKLDEARNTASEESHNLVDFTDEEGYGKYLDLHSVYSEYLNLKQFEKIDYVTFLQTFDKLFEYSRDLKNADYRKYLLKMLDYLYDYLGRAKPLVDQTKLVLSVKEEFEDIWSRGQFPGWRKDTSKGAMVKHTGAHLDLAAFNSPEELMSLGLDRLKSALMALGLKCGGTLEERASRLFSTKGKAVSELAPSLFAKSKAKKDKDEADRNKDIAFLEAQVYKLIEMFGEQRSATKDNVERRLARTAEELQEEEMEEAVISDDEDDEERVLYNPKNIPLGWDGKPIPYWLYKLHGLNLSYKCEICGDFTYRGPKAFQRHFSEWRHAYGMRRLGIPNTAHFANVTEVEAAKDCECLHLVVVCLTVLYYNGLN